ncbi:MAG: 6-bladed beta-propeller [Desulfobacterales bacterium]|nr:6-bladed beta-propeller [Desulfobacterales bacterium]
MIIVKNPIEPIYGEGAFNLEEELSIGETEGQEEYMLSSPRSIAVDDECNIYVLDLKESHIKVFDNEGIYQKTIGRRGQGPGEFQGPLGIQITAKNESLVNNLTSSRLIYYSLNGEFLREDQMTGIPRALLKMDSNFDYICAYPKSEQIFKVALEKYDSSQKKLFSIAEVEIENYSARAKSIIFNITKENEIIWAITDKYEIMITDAVGNLTRKIIRDYDSVEILEEEKQSFLRQIPLSPGEEFPKYFPPLRDTFISVDGNGKIYIGTYERTPDGNGYYYDVFDSEGKYIVKMPIRHTKRSPIIWKSGKLYTIEADEDGFQYVKRYKVTWNY